MLNVGLVGLGFMGKTHLHAYHQMKNCQVKAIYTRNEVNDKELPTMFSGSFVKEYDELLNNDEIDIIDICLPTYLHEEFIMKAANAGKHIFCEKPLTLTMDSANRIVKEVRKNGVRLFVGHVLRFWSEYEIIKSYSKNGKLDDIEIVHAKRLGQKPKWSSWFQYPNQSGGALFDLHIHDIDYVYYLLGEVDSVYAVGNRNKTGAWDHIMTTLTFKNNSVAYVEASHRMPMEFPFTMSFRAQARQNTLDFHVAAGENIENIDDSSAKFMFYTDRSSTPVKINGKDAFQNELSYFVDCIENNSKNTIIPLDDVLYTMKLLKAIEKSLKSGQIVKVSEFTIEEE